METKADFYKKLIEIHKKTGQGLSGIVKIKSSEYSQYLDELIEEGLVKCCDTGGSLGHPESNRFYMPTKGYNVWEDVGDDNVHSRFAGRFLACVRYYLDACGDGDEGPLHPSRLTCSRNVDFMEAYAKWLKRNEKELEIMLNLDDLYFEKEITFTKDELGWIKERKWYKENETIEDCENKSKESIDLYKKELIIINQLEELYKTDLKKYQKELDKLLLGKQESETENCLRLKLHKWFETQNKKTKIKTLL